jgi:hypothetical protein
MVATLAVASFLAAALVVLTDPSAGAGTPVPSTITLDAPTQVAIGAPVAATGTLVTDPGGSAIGGATVDWRADCLTDGFSSLSTGQATTAGDGSFAITYDPGYCTQARLTVTWDQAAAADHDLVSADTEVPWRLAQLAGDLPVEVFVGDDAYGSVTYTVDGVPQSGVAVSIGVTYGGGPLGGVDEGGITDVDGVVHFQIPSYLATSYAVTAYVPATSDTTPASWSGGGSTEHMVTTLTMSALGYPFTAGGQASLQGVVARQDDNVSGVTVYVFQDDHDGQGWHGIGSAGTDATGHFTLDRLLVHAGDVSFYARVDGSPGDTPQAGRYTGATSQPIQITVHPQNTTLYLTPDHTTYVAGQTATIQTGAVGMQPADPWRELTLTAKPFGGLATVLYDDGVLTASGVTVQQVMSTNETLHATVPADAAHTAGDALLDIHVREALTSSSDRAVYPTTQAPRLSATNGSHRAGECLRFVVQKRTSGGWRTVTISACRATDAGGRAGWLSTATRTAGGHFRFRAAFAGDDLDLAAHSAWVAFRFRT